MVNPSRFLIFLMPCIISSGRQAKKIIFLRHGITEMNEYLSSQPWGSVGFKDPAFWDTRLSARGQAESIHLNEVLKGEKIGVNIQGVELLVSSPLRRALHTAELVFANILDEVPRIVHADARERLYLSSDVGSMKSELKAAFPLWDYSGLNDSEWWFTSREYSLKVENSQYVEWRPPGKYVCVGEPAAVFRSRIHELKEWLVRRPEQTILLVSHWGVIRALTGGSLSNCEMKVCGVESLLQEPLVDP